jgi:hypothetical protein
VHAGAAGGANSTVRQVGSALGVSTIGSLLTARTIAAASKGVQAAALPAAVKSRALAGVRALGSGYRPPASMGRTNAAVIRRVVGRGIISGTHWALVFAAVVIALGALCSLLIPSDAPWRRKPLQESVDPQAALLVGSEV